MYNLGDVSPQPISTPSPESQISSEEEEPTSCLTASTDKSYQPDAAISSNYGELLKKQKYVLELNELGNITKEKVIYEMDCEPSLDERL